MGSSGSGNFSDYSGSGNRKVGGGGSSGGESGEDQCGKAFSASLEDVAQYQFFSQTGAVPPVGTRLSLVLKARVVAVDPNGTDVGALPTRYNYLAACLKAGFQYVGIVQAASLGAAPNVSADFTTNT